MKNLIECPVCGAGLRISDSVFGWHAACKNIKCQLGLFTSRWKTEKDITEALKHRGTTKEQSEKMHYMVGLIWGHANYPSTPASKKELAELETAIINLVCEIDWQPKENINEQE